MQRAFRNSDVTKAGLLGIAKQIVVLGIT